ncbi:MFS transporter [Actinosynnema sp. NPDC047251]|uniref:MFS transporter n=1 Tax=Saccharothrix espanaensis TaxID=103731 RepID=UPI0002FA3BB3|nr:MFS transporter [Saccharothrix espanaensis]
MSTPAPTPASTPDRYRSWPAIGAVTTGIFAVVTTEILPIGLLGPMAAEFGVSTGTAGLMMTTPGLVAAVAAPVVTATAGRLDRRATLCGLVLLLAVAAFLAAFAPAFWVVLVSRFLVGLVIGGFWSIAAGLAGRLVAPGTATPEKVGTATAVVFSAVPLGSVLGVPAGTFLGDLWGWRAAFVATGVVALGVLVALAVFLPPLPAQRATRLAVVRELVGRNAVRAGLAVTFLVVLAHFGTYTYVTPFLREVTGASPAAITAFLLVYGAAGVVGNFLAGARAHRPGTFPAAIGLLACATLLLPVAGGTDAGAVVLLVVWGLAYGAVPVCSQTWFARAAPDAPEAASVVFTSSFQATLSLGALAGGVVVDATSPAAVMVLGGLVAAATATVLRWRTTTAG